MLPVSLGLACRGRWDRELIHVTQREQGDAVELHRGSTKVPAGSRRSGEGEFLCGGAVVSRSES